MKKISNKDLERITGGFSAWAGIGIATIIVFIAGIAEGITNPSKCQE